MVRLSPAVSVVVLVISAIAFQADARSLSTTQAPAGHTEQALDAPAAPKPPSLNGAANTGATDDEETYAQLRNLAIAGKQVSALHGLTRFLEQDLHGRLRMRAYVTAISVATNIEDWPSAFALLNKAMEHLHSAPEDTSGLLAAASQLHTQVGDIERAIDLGQRAIQAAEVEQDDSQICRTTVALALAHESSNQLSSALEWRQRQIKSCTRANDPLFAANGKFGLGKVLTMQEQYAKALKWGEEALIDYQAQDYEAGANNAREVIAYSLIALRQSPQRAEALLTGLSSYYRAHNIAQSIGEVEQMWAVLSETRGDAAASIAHLKEAAKYSKEAERSMRVRQLAYLQIQFGTQLKEQQISLLETEKALAEATSTAALRRQLLLGIGVAGLLIAAILLSLLLRRTLHDRQRYRWEAQHDGLTRLVNQQQLYTLGAAAFAGAAQQASTFTAVALDIDLFKQINDSHGHAAGDAALQSLGKWIRAVAGGRSIAARRGGDEFMILLNGDATQAKAILQRLRERIAPITLHNQTFRFTVSAGICQADTHSASFEQLLHHADQALYRAKQQGRNRFVCWHEELPDTTTSAGSLVVVGSGIQFGRHVSERTLSEIQQAQVVFCLADPFALAMISNLRRDTINLGTHYAPGKDRRETYREIDATIMQKVQSGKDVCAVFYGHPGVFADVPHRVIRKTRAIGLPARMEPGISAEACLYADLGIDPGQRGVQSLEATHFLYFDRQLDSQGLVLLWQVALAGDWSCRRLHAEREGLQALVTKLLRWYPANHEVILYEAAQLPIDNFRAETLLLCDLPDAHYKEFTTLVIPALPDELKHDPSSAPTPA